MKYSLAILAILLGNISCIFAQWGVIPPIPTIDNKGNRTQTYPHVTIVSSNVQNLINQVSITNLEDDIRYMQNLGIREAQSSAAFQTQNWLYDKLVSFGMDAYIHRFTSSMAPANGDTIEAGNVVAVKLGTEFPDQFIIISSHYDHQSGPGADDNASGTAGVVECARIISQTETKRSIIFVPFNAEENWMHGSVPFANKCAEENMNILGVFNLDMLGFYPATGYGEIKMFTGHSVINQKLFEYHQQIANLYIPEVPTFKFSFGDVFGADHSSFIWNDYPALYIGDIEYIDIHPCYHQPCDTIGEFGGVNNLSLVEAFVKATIASVVELANGWLPPQNFSAVSRVNEVMLSWDEMPETSLYKVYKNNLLLTETTSNYYMDNNVALGETYSYFVKGIKTGSLEESNPSNIDSIVFSPPLTIPYTLDLESNMEELKYWWAKSWSVWSPTTGPKFLYSPNTEFGIMELDWFSIPENTPDITLRIIARDASSTGIMQSTHAFVEVTSDRKTWHKIAKNIDFNRTQPDTLMVSLNRFTGSSFFQLRIRLGCHGTRHDVGRLYLFSLDIDHTPVSIKENKYSYFKGLQVYPNPSTGKITVKTESENSYSLGVYDLNGKRILFKNAFQDGELDLSALSKGTYLIEVSREKHQVAKKIVIQ